jgi:hypothetical protein
MIKNLMQNYSQLIKKNYLRLEYKLWIIEVLAYTIIMMIMMMFCLNFLIIKDVYLQLIYNLDNLQKNKKFFNIKIK